MPSSLTTFHSNTLGCSPRLPVSVCGTDAASTSDRSFSCVSTPEDSRLGCPAHSHSRLGLRLHGWTAIHKAALLSFHGPFVGVNALSAGPEF
jgi:hypothetical protein